MISVSFPVRAPCCGGELEVSRFLLDAFNTHCVHCGAPITASRHGVDKGHRAASPYPPVAWLCEWCVPSDIPAVEAERCSIRWCAAHQAMTWHYPKE